MIGKFVLACVVAQGSIILRPPAPPLATEREVVVEAGDVERQNSVVWVGLTAADSKRHLVLRDEKGRTVPFQVDERGRGAFVVTGLKAHGRATYRLVEDPKAAPLVKAHVSVATTDPQVFRVGMDGKKVIAFQGGAAPLRPDLADIARGGYIDPVFSPSGVVLTEAYPAEQPQHLGIWSFWRELEVEKHTANFWERYHQTGHIQMESKGPTWEGPVHGGFEARQIFTGIKPFGGQTLLHERWRVTAYARPVSTASYFVFDIESEQTTPIKKPVQIVKAKDGGIGVRGRLEWTKGNSELIRLNSEGTPNAVSARWAYIGGKVKGKVAGIAVLSPPGNLNFPQALNSGEFPGEPLLNFLPNLGGDVTVEPLRPLETRYRFVALDGKPDPKMLERLWQDFAAPPHVTITPAKAKGH